jgi:hypothetical protein
MITTAEPRGSGRVLRIALVASIVAHLLAGLVFFAASDETRRLLSRLDVRHPVKQENETVAMSTALHLEKRTRPTAGSSHPRAALPRQVARPIARSRPAPQVVARVPRAAVRPQPVERRPAVPKHELAKVAPHATAAPRTRAAPEQRIAALQRSERPAEPRAASQPGRLSQAQIAKIENDLAKTIAQARAEAAPLSDTRSRTVPTSTQHFVMNFSGIANNLRRVQGLCHAIKSWQEDGWNYYWDSCEVQEPDGAVREKALPWPVRYRPQADPNLGTGPDPATVLPVPGWHPDPDHPIDPDFIPFLRDNGFSP